MRINLVETKKTFFSFVFLRILNALI